MLGKVTGVYRLSRDVELKYLPSSVAVANIGLVNSAKYKKQSGEQVEKKCFIDASIIGKLSEVANQYLRKGSQIFIDADLEMDEWIDNQTQQKRYKHKLKINQFEMLGSKQDNSPQQNNYNQPQQQNQYDPKTNVQNHYNNAPQPQGGMNQNIPTIDVDNDEIPHSRQ